MNRHLINALKVIVIVALFAYIYYNIQWDDSISYVDANGEVTQTVSGEIIGSWNSPNVEFLPRGADASLRLSSAAENAKISPGILTYFKNLDLAYFSYGVALLFCSVLLAATRWWWLLSANNLNVSLFDSIRYTWLGLFFNNIVPGQTGGDVVKAIYITRRCRGDGVRAFLSVFVDRVLGLCSLALLAAVMVLFFTERFLEIAIGIWSLLIVAMILTCMFFSRRLRERLGLRHLLFKLPHKAQKLLKEVDAAIFHYRQHKAGIALWVGIGIGNHVLAVSGIVCFGAAINAGLPWHEYFILVPVVTIASAVPIAPNGWGIGEALYGKFFGEYGAVYLPDNPNAEIIMSTRGIAVSFLYRISFSVMSLLGGLVLLFEKQRITKDEIQQSKI